MVYGKEYRILQNFSELREEEKFEKVLIDLCVKEDGVLFIEGTEINLEKIK